MKPLELQRELDKGNIAPFYLLYGEELFLIEKTLRRLKGLLIDPRLESFNFSLYHGGENDPRQIINTAQTVPLSAQRRLVVVKDADQIKAWGDFASYFERPHVSTCLVLCSNLASPKTELTSLFKQKGTAVRFYHPFRSEIPEWIGRMVKEHQKQMDREAMALLIEYVDNDLQRIANELEKIIVYVGERKEISRADVEAVIVAAKEVSIFNLTDYLAAKDGAQALSVLNRLLEEGEPSLRILSMIARHYRLMVRAKEMLMNGLPATEVSKELGISSFHLKTFFQQAEVFPLNRATRYFTMLFQSDRRLKSTRVSETLILENLIARLCTD